MKLTRISTPLSLVANGLFSATEGKCGDNAVHDGVEVDASGRVVAYHICNGYPYSSMLTDIKWVRVEAFAKRPDYPNVLQLMVQSVPTSIGAFRISPRS